jgi:hypothetical protein
MSNNINQELIERAAYFIDVYESKLPAQMLERALDDNDLEKVYEIIKSLEAEPVLEETSNDCY